MKQIIKTSFIMFVILTVITGLLYPVVVWAAAKVLFPFQAEGSLIKNGTVVSGSALIAQDFKRPEYFHPRPSAVSYDASASGGSNMGASSPALRKIILERAAKEKEMNPLNTGDVPMEMLTASSSGLDPEITVKAALWQAKRVASARGVDEKVITDAMKKMTAGPLFGFIGPERVNVLKLNRYLDTLKVK